MNATTRPTQPHEVALPDSDLLRRASERVLFRQACRAAVATGGFRAAWIGFPRGRDDRPGLMLASAISEVLNTAPNTGELGATLASTSWLGPIPQLLADDLLDPSPGRGIFEWQRTAVHLQLRHEAHTIGLFTLYPNPGRRVSNDELTWLQQVADDLARTVMRSRIALLLRQAEDADATGEVTVADAYVAMDASPEVNTAPLVADDRPDRADAEKLGEQALLLDMATDAIVVRDLEHNIAYWSKGAQQLFGWTSAEAVGRSERDLLYLNSVPFDNAMVVLVRDGDWVGEILQVDKAGARRIMDGHWVLVKDDTGEPQSVLSVYTDITARRQLEDQFLRAQRVESIGTLAGGLAHDLNNMLTPIMMSVELLRLDETNNDRLETLDTIAASARKGAAMLQQVLSFARGVGGRRSPVDVGHVLLDVEKIAREIFPRNIRVQVQHHGTRWCTAGDPTQLHQVLLNLAVNARDAMPDGGTLEFRVDNVTLDENYAGMEPDAGAGPYVVVEVEDSGIGMSEAVRERIFEPFFTTKDPGQGTGLGLSTSLAIVKNHGGFVRVNSEAGKGTRFQVYLPGCADPVDESPIAVTGELPRGHGELVLVVDHEESIRQIMRQTLEAFGYRVKLVADGAEAVAFFASNRHQIALVLADMTMAPMHGADLIQILLMIDPDACVIATSGRRSNEMGPNALEVGVKQVLRKPCTAETLLVACREAIGVRETPAGS